MKINTVFHNAASQCYPLLSANVAVSPLHGFIVATLIINEIYLKLDKVKI